MENENKCFFSVSLENGIVITGNNPYEVYWYLQKMHSAFFELWNHYKMIGLRTLQEDTMKEQETIGNALDTITKHTNIH